jgi:hypothetical protein
MPIKIAKRLGYTVDQVEIAIYGRFRNNKVAAILGSGDRITADKGREA